MDLRAEKLALAMLARHGIAAIWKLHIIAGHAHRDGYHSSAALVLEIADAAEDAWHRATEPAR